MLIFKFKTRNKITKLEKEETFPITFKDFNELILKFWENDMPINEKIFSLTVLVKFLEVFWIKSEEEMVLSAEFLEEFWSQIEKEREKKKTFFQKINIFFKSLF